MRDYSSRARLQPAHPLVQSTPHPLWLLKVSSAGSIFKNRRLKWSVRFFLSTFKGVLSFKTHLQLQSYLWLMKLDFFWELSNSPDLNLSFWPFFFRFCQGHVYMSQTKRLNSKRGNPVQMRHWAVYLSNRAFWWHKIRQRFVCVHVLNNWPQIKAYRCASTGPLESAHSAHLSTRIQLS